MLLYETMSNTCVFGVKIINNLNDSIVKNKSFFLGYSEDLFTSSDHCDFALL